MKGGETVKKSFSYITCMGYGPEAIVVSGTVEVPENAASLEVNKACHEEALRIMREEPQRVFENLRLIVE